jgi:alanine-synthesizing transaminase
MVVSLSKEIAKGLLMISASRRTEKFNYAIRDIVLAAEQLERAGRKVFYLNIGDPQVFGFRPPAHVVEAVAHALRDGFTGYSHSMGLFDARESVAQYANDLGVRTGPDDVLITSGASEAAELILSALLDSGDEVLTPAPGYPIYPAILNKLDAVNRHYRVDESNEWQPSPDEVRSLISGRTRAIILINPNNPTGRIVPDAVTAELLEIAERHNLLVISDEVYRELCFDEQPTPASFIAQEVGGPLITLESLSKTHMVPGWRVGWMRFTNRDKMGQLVSSIVRLASGRLCSPTPAQYAIRPALQGDKHFLEAFMREIRRRRDIALAQVSSLGGVSCPEPQAAFYLMVKVHDTGGRPDDRFVLDFLQETGVLVVHGSGFGADPRHGYFRLVFLADEDTLRMSFEHLRRFTARIPV